MKQRDLNPDVIREKKKLPWLGVKDIYEMYPVGMSKARDMRNDVLDKAKDEGYWMPDGKEKVVPTCLVLECFPIDGRTRQFKKGRPACNDM